MDVHDLEKNLDKAIRMLAEWKEIQRNTTTKDRRVEWSVTSNEGAIRIFTHRLSLRIDELFPTEKLYAMISNNTDLETKIGEYEVTLQFFQEYLANEQKQLQEAKKKSLPEDILEFLQSRVEKLESNVDRYQSWISTFKSQMKINEG